MELCLITKMKKLIWIGNNFLNNLKSEIRETQT